MKKSYKGFWLWVLAYCGGFLPIIYMNADAAITTRLTLLYTAAMMAILMMIIEKTDHIYWINGVSFDEAEAAGYEKRMEYAHAHLKRFAGFAVIYAVFTRISHSLKACIWLDIAVMAAGLVATAVSTINIKLE